MGLFASARIAKIAPPRVPQGALRPADDGWVVRGPGGEDDLVPVTPHTEGRSGIGASCFVKGNVRPGLEWKRGAFYWRGTSRKWEAPRGAAGAPRPGASACGSSTLRDAA